MGQQRSPEQDKEMRELTDEASIYIQRMHESPWLNRQPAPEQPTLKTAQNTMQAAVEKLNALEIDILQ